MSSKIEQEILDVISNEPESGVKLWESTTLNTRPSEFFPVLRKMVKQGSIFGEHTGEQVSENCNPKMEYWI